MRARRFFMLLIPFAPLFAMLFTAGGCVVHERDRVVRQPVRHDDVIVVPARGHDWHDDHDWHHY